MSLRMSQLLETEETTLDQRWAFPGFVTSDYGATHATAASVAAGLDQEMPGAAYYGLALDAAVRSGQVTMATLNTMVKEEYFAKLQGAPASTGSRFRNAAVDGYNTVVEGLISVGLFLLSAGPSLLLWAAVLFFPARFAWKKWRTANPPRRSGDAEEE